MPDVINRHAYSWTSDASGDESITIPPGQLNGTITRVTTIPGLTTEQPDDNYDVTLLDIDGIDLLQDFGLNRDETNTEQVCPVLAIQESSVTVAYAPITVDNAVTLVIANAGASKTGKVVFHVKKG